MGEYARERLNTDRVCADWQTVQRGTMQHEIFEGDDAVPFIDGATIVGVQVPSGHRSLN